MGLGLLAKMASIAHMAKMTASRAPVLVMTISIPVVAGMVVVVRDLRREIAGMAYVAGVTVASVARSRTHGLATRRQARRLLLVLTIVALVLALLTLVELLLMIVLLVVRVCS